MLILMTFKEDADEDKRSGGGGEEIVSEVFVGRNQQKKWVTETNKGERVREKRRFGSCSSPPPAVMFCFNARKGLMLKHSNQRTLAECDVMQHQSLTQDEMRSVKKKEEYREDWWLMVWFSRTIERRHKTKRRN